MKGFSQELTEQHTPRVIPPGWEAVNANSWMNRRIGLAVILTVENHDDGKRWLHISTSRRRRIPSYDDLCLVKLLFIGRDRKAVQVFAPEAEHVNICERALHLWCCLDDDPLPDFRINGML